MSKASFSISRITQCSTPLNKTKQKVFFPTTKKQLVIISRLKYFIKLMMSIYEVNKSSQKKTILEIPRWWLEGGSRKHASKSKILQRHWRYNL
jgi:hypothetical protein